ncbi:enoyl-CoA hydratase/isomerase family protein [Seongchinamella sediminis]|uniref:Enoyl-CoA hydratase/isomerase family protein n=1 Tax=Seongchinamella sediminis TaxID=2283635 RepID=A0A3L7E4S9_9GAMM|nr:enoyl-CoA hydratase-related protein [Seongchinamella sediminis]RLQ23643.1 enoyl-CoA hydratase/isomerase family protein [Seongchinamella sediminis]
MTDTVLYRRAGHIGYLTLNNPARHNSLGQGELEAIQAFLAEVERDAAVRVLVVSGTGDKTFCAGAALNELGAGKISGDCFQATTDQLAALSIPTVASLNGNVFGGGVELALSCDFRIGIEGIRMRVPAAAIGLCYPLSGINRFVQRLGVNLAKRILVASEQFDADAMKEIGFLDHLVMPTQRQEATDDLAHHIAGLAPLAVRAMKQILQQAASGAIDEVAAAKLAAMCLESDDLQEGFAAQREKRKPLFKGA